MAKKLTKRQLNKHLEHLDKKALITEIGKLFTKFKEVAQFYQMEYGDAEGRTSVLDKYKKKITNQFHTIGGRPKDPQSFALENVLNDFEKVAISQQEIADLTLHRVEEAVSFTLAYGDIDEDFYVSTEGAYADALAIIDKENLKDLFYARVHDVIDKSWEMGWGFPGTLQEIYEEVYGEFIR